MAETAKTWLRFSFNFVLLLILLMVTNVSLTSAISMVSLGFKEGLSLIQVINLVLFLITFLIGIRVLLDGMKLFDSVASTVIRKFLKTQSGMAKKLVFEFLLLLVLSLFSNALISAVQSWKEGLGFLVSSISLILILIISYDISKTIYLILEIPIHEIADKISEFKKEKKP
ncbi:MAG: hypothetical protein QXS21_02085 [Thermoproteota archaeon]|nr:hypothetical protein [Candidatus Brockarchaeota archaeon]MBO3768462.1 hypothetical protein [Candidatus Brockarchaeota archaeon]MBO3801298.1 hypothetical protein [Candidatus Brockarchaeota archaeon]